jgi:hypothetical protein
MSHHEAGRELYLFATNDARTYRQIAMSYVNLERKWRKGIFDPIAALRLLNYASGDAAQAYVVQHCSPRDKWFHIFPIAARDYCSKLLLDDWQAEIDAGNGWIRP